MKLFGLFLLMVSLGLSLVACQQQAPGSLGLTVTARPNPTVVIFPTPTKEEDIEYETDTPEPTATPEPKATSAKTPTPGKTATPDKTAMPAATRAPTPAASPQPPPGDVPDILARSAEASARMPERGIHAQMLDAQGNVIFNTILEYDPPDRVRRWQGVSNQWQDTITIGGKSWVRGYVDGKDTGWVTAEGLEDPAADAMLDSFRNPTDSGEDSAVLEEATKALGLTNPRWERRFIGPDLMEKRPTWLHEQVCYDGDRPVITVRTWLGQEDLLTYRSETRMNLPNPSELMAYFSNVRVTFWYEVELEPPIP